VIPIDFTAYLWLNWAILFLTAGALSMLLLLSLLAAAQDREDL
jgi:hypothetical protein